MLENIKLSFQGIWSHKMRSVLTMLGIIIGIASIIAIVSTIKGTNEQIKQNLVGAGTNTVDIKICQGTEEYMMDWNGAPAGFPVIEQDTIDALEANDEIESASYFVKRSWVDNVYYQNAGLQGAYVYGTDINYMKTTGMIISKGRGFTETDFKKFNKVVIINEKSARSLFGDENPVGKILEIKGEPFTIIGVCAASTNFEPTIESINDYYTYKSDSNTAVYIPYASWPIIYSYDEPQHVVVKAASTEDMTKAGQKAEELLNSKVTKQRPAPGGGGTEEDAEPGSQSSQAGIAYKATDTLEKAKQLQELSSATSRQLIWIAGISLIVGGIGVMNIMLVSVTERTREIGLKKAIGARKGMIMGQFLTESAMLTLLGGLIGIVAGIILANVISGISSTPIAISLPAILISVLFSMIIGIVFGFLPSYKAANLNPIDALRHE